MKFSAPSAFALIAAFVPSLVSAVNITVTVGATGLVFDPQQITAKTGDNINFEFRGGNHTVTQSSFANPCAWQFNTALQQKGFNSGFVPFNNASNSVGVFTLNVTQTDSPIWFFCGRVGHCKGGMYGSINAPTTGNKTFTQFAANVQTTNEPGLGVTVPFTPTPNANANSTSPSSVSSTSSAAAIPPASGFVTSSNPSSSGTATPKQSSGTTTSVTAGSIIVLSLAGIVAGLVL